MPKFTITLRQPDGNQWDETYNKDVPCPQTWAEETVAWFNETLRHGEQPRELLAVKVLDAEALGSSQPTQEKPQ